MSIPKRPPASDASFDDLAIVEPIVQICEQRDALSVSLVGAALAEWIQPWTSPLDPVPEATPTAADPAIVPLALSSEPAAVSGEPIGAIGSLLDQAADVRAASPQLTGVGQTIAIIDSGIAYDHLALGGGYGPGYRVVGGWDFAENDANPYDDAPAGYHGSHVAGLAAGNGTMPGGLTFQGVAPGADLVALRVFDDFGAGQMQWIESALRWVHDNQDAYENPITAVNLSVGAELTDGNRDQAMAMIEDELRDLYNDGILVFAAAGNSFDPSAWNTNAADQILYPASSSWVVGVASIGGGGQLSDFSQRTDGIFAAEGQAIRSTVPEHVYGYDGDINDFARLTGTSMASPQLAGASVLVRQAMIDAGLNPSGQDVLERMGETASMIVDPLTGARVMRLNLAAAVSFQSSANDGGDAGSPIVNGYAGTYESEDLTLDLAQFNASSSAIQPMAELSGENKLMYLSSADGLVVIDGGGGGDELRILGSDRAESVTLRPASDGHPSILDYDGGQIEIRGFSQIVFIGGGGDDRATLFDSIRDDTYQSSTESMRLTGVGYQFTIQQVPTVLVHATGGGNDVAHLSDTPGDDVLNVRSQFTSLRGGGQSQVAFGFERVFAYSNLGGRDSAIIADSPADDLMVISASQSIVSGGNYRATAIGFASVTANATQGGDDLVRIYVNDPSGVWQTTDTLTQWSGGGVTRLARGFERAEAFEMFAPIPLTTQSVHFDPDNGFGAREQDDALRRGLRGLFESL